jgi:gliding motility-associated-like protein
MSVSPDAVTCDDIGPNPVTLTVTDNHGNENSCLATVTVVDDLAPSLTCPGDRTEPVDGSMNFTIPDYTGLAIITDNCNGTPLLTQDPLPGTVISGIGTLQTITLRADDGYGNISQCTFSIVLIEGKAPTIACPPDQTEYVDPQCRVILPDYTGRAIVNKADTVFQSPASGTVLTGSSTSHIITLTAKNIAGDSAVCTFNVLLLDDSPPHLACPSDTMVSALPGACSIVVNNISPLSTSDNCGVDEIRYTLSGSTNGTGIGDASGTAFNKGISSVWYRIRDVDGNVDSCGFNVTVLTSIEAPDSAFSDRVNLCPDDGGSITLMYTGGTTANGVIARWYDASSFPAPIGSGNNLTIPAPLITTAYYVRLEGDCDTTSAVSVVVTVHTPSSDPGSASSNVDTVCAGQGSIRLSYSGGTPGSSGVAHWYTDAGFTNLVGTGNNLQVPAPDVTTTYHVRFESVCDTSSSVSITVTVLPRPSPVFAEKDDRVCIAGTVGRYVVSGLPGSTFDWRLSGGTMVADYNDSVWVDWGGVPGTYSITVTENATSGCSSDPLMALVNVSNPVVDLGFERTVCEGSTIEIIPQGSFTFQMWHDGSTGTRYIADTTELVKIQVFDQAGCAASDSVLVTMQPFPSVNLGKDTALCGNYSLILDAGNPGATYLWSTGETTREIEVYPGFVVYSVEVTYAGVCSVTDEISILPCGGSDILSDIPNLFTPNGDGVNDTWFFYESAAFPEMVVEIYDRWGKRVYISEPGYPVPWDGRSMHGGDMPMDSYHYIIKPGKGYHEVVGTITIVR